MKAVRAIALAALLLLPLLPIAGAAAPDPRPWSGYNTLSETRAVAIAREGTTIGVALANAVTTGTTPLPGGLPGLPTPSSSQAETDLSILDHEYGFARNASLNPPPTATQASLPQGRSHVVVSRDGNAVASLGIELGPVGSGGGSGANEYLTLYHARIAPGGNWSGSTPTESRVDLGSTAAVVPVGLAISGDGARVVVLTAEGTNYALRGYSAGSGGLASAFARVAGGVPRALAATGDLERSLVVGQFAEGNFTYGGGKIFPFAQTNDVAAAYLDTSANNTDARGAALSLDGRVAAIGGADGRLLVFRNARQGLTTPGIVSLGSGGLSNLTMSEDGARLASVLGNTLTAVDTSGAVPTTLWNATVGGASVSLPAMDRTGSLILVGSTGTGGGVFAYSDADAQPLWTIPGETRGVAVDSAGSRIAYIQRTAVAGARVSHLLSLELAEGGKVAAQQTVTAPGQLNVAVRLRNDGSAMERIVFEDTSADVNVTSDPVVVNVRPGAIVPVNLTVSIAPGLASPRSFNVTARSLTSGVVDNVTISIAPRPTLDVKLFLNETDLLVQPGVPTSILLTVVNNGTGNANVGIRATQTVSSGAVWPLTLSDSTLTTLRGTRSPVTVTITPPADVANGTSSTILFTLEGQDVFDTARVTFRVNPELRVELQATPPTRYVAPTERAVFNVTVTNAGSLPRDFEIFYEVLDDDGRSWGVDMESQTVRLEPLGRKVLPLTVTAPANVQPDERIAIRVIVRSIAEAGVLNDTRVNETADVFAIGIAPRVTTPGEEADNGIPMPAPAVALLSLALLALLRRRRS